MTTADTEFDRRFIVATTRGRLIDHRRLLDEFLTAGRRQALISAPGSTTGHGVSEEAPRNSTPRSLVNRLDSAWSRSLGQ